MFEGIGVKSNVNLEALIKVGTFISGILGRRTSSKVALATENKGSLPPRYSSL
jgi:hypothetical protein